MIHTSLVAISQLKEQQGKLSTLTLGDDYYGWNQPAYIEVWRYADTAPQTNNQANTAVVPQEKAYYEANEVKYVNGHLANQMRLSSTRWVRLDRKRHPGFNG